MFDFSKIKVFFYNKIEKIKSININLRNVFNIPNFLSFFRLFLIYPFILSFLNENYIKASKILIISGMTDLLDGFLARVLNQRTKFGEILDPIADKLTLISIMICAANKIPSIVPFMIILICKEVCMFMAGAFLLKKVKRTIKARWYGKLGTAFFYLSIIIVIVVKALWGVENEFLTNCFMCLTTLLMFHALIRYLFEFISIVRAKNQINK